MGPDYLAGLFILGRIIRPLQVFDETAKDLVGVTQAWGWIIWPDISSMVG
jgi:hypothetical protein